MKNTNRIEVRVSDVTLAWLMGRRNRLSATYERPVSLAEVVRGIINVAVANEALEFPGGAVPEHDRSTDVEHAETLAVAADVGYRVD